MVKISFFIKKMKENEKQTKQNQYLKTTYMKHIKMP